MVAEHERDLDRQLAGPLPEQQVVQAVRRLGHQHEGAERPADHVELPLHVEALATGASAAATAAPVDETTCRRMKKRAGVVARELLRLGDVAAGVDDGAADGVHDARTVFADERQGPVGVGHIGHGASPS